LTDETTKPRVEVIHAAFVLPAAHDAGRYRALPFACSLSERVDRAPSSFHRREHRARLANELHASERTAGRATSGRALKRIDRPLEA